MTTLNVIGAVLVGAGGLFGYFKTQSVPSLAGSLLPFSQENVCPSFLYAI
jgi:uncharacterized membrane protein (UPF0136 family)